MEPIRLSVWRRARRNTARSVSAVEIARGEYQDCLPAVVRCSALQEATAFSVNRYKMRKQTVEPVFGIIKSAIGFTRFRLRGLANAATEWSLVTLAYNCRRITRMQAA